MRCSKQEPDQAVLSQYSTTDTYGGDVTAATMDVAQVADPLQLQANTISRRTRNRWGIKALYAPIFGDAKTALDSGLTDREMKIANPPVRDTTLMGRTFDQSGAIAEAEAYVQEDNARRMQKAFAQSVLGQEAGLQQGDITRGMAQESEQAGLQQRADLAQAQMDQQANAFDDAAQRTAMGNQARQQANQFGVGATMEHSVSRDYQITSMRWGNPYRWKHVYARSVPGVTWTRRRRKLFRQDSPYSDKRTTDYRADRNTLIRKRD